MPKKSAQSVLETKNKVEVPRSYHVVLHNDDITTMDFVVKVLRQVFFLPIEKATAFMLDVHQKGSAIVGTYSFDIATSKAAKVVEMARNEGYPLEVTIEPAASNHNK